MFQSDNASTKGRCVYCKHECHAVNDLFQCRDKKEKILVCPACQKKIAADYMLHHDFIDISCKINGTYVDFLALKKAIKNTQNFYIDQISNAKDRRISKEKDPNKAGITWDQMKKVERVERWIYGHNKRTVSDFRKSGLVIYLQDPLITDLERCSVLERGADFCKLDDFITCMEQVY